MAKRGLSVQQIGHLLWQLEQADNNTDEESDDDGMISNVLDVAAFDDDSDNSNIDDEQSDEECDSISTYLPHEAAHVTDNSVKTGDFVSTIANLSLETITAVETNIYHNDIVESSARTINNISDDTVQSRENNIEVPNVINTDVNLPQEECPRNKKILTRNSLVNSINNALDESNYEKWTQPEERKIHNVIMDKNKKSSHEKSITWCNQKTRIGKKISSENIIRRYPLVNPAASDATTPLLAWQLFMTDEMIADIVINTNKKISRALSTKSERPPTQADYNHKCCDDIEIRAFIGLLYARALFSMNKLNHHYLFANSIGPPIFSATMSAKRFSFLNTNISFDDRETRSIRWQSDRFAAIRKLFEQFNDNCSSTMNPKLFISLDETLYSCRNQVNFKQYNAKKPAKYGLLFKSVNCSHSAFTFRTVVYAGKPAGKVIFYTN